MKRTQIKMIVFSFAALICALLSACEKTGFQKKTGSVNPTNPFQKVLKSDNGITFTIEATNAELLKGFNEASFQVEALKELPNASSTTKMPKQSTQITLPEQQVHIKVSDVELPKGAEGYSIRINNASAKAGTVYVIWDSEGNRRAASITNHTNEGIFAKSEYTRCEPNIDVDEDWVPNGQADVYPGYSHNFNWTPSKVFYNRVIYLYDSTAPGFVTIDFAVPGSCNFSEGINPAEQGEACNPFCTNCKTGPIPKATVRQISSFAAHANELRPLINLYVKHKPEMESLYLNNVAVNKAISNLFNAHKDFIINSFSGHPTVLGQKEIAGIYNLLEVIQQHTNKEDLKTATANLQNQINGLKGSTLKEALHQIEHR